MASTEAEGYMAEGDKLLREQKLEEAKDKYEAAAGRCVGAEPSIPCQ